MGLSRNFSSSNILLSGILVTIILIDRPTTVVPHLGTSFSTFMPWSFTDTINSAYVITSIVSFVFFWVATSLYLRHFTSKLGVAKYWIIVSLPLIYFMAQFLTLALNLFGSMFEASPTLFSILITLIFMYTKLAGGVFFGIAFLIASKYPEIFSRSEKLRHNFCLRAYLTFSI